MFTVIKILLGIIFYLNKLKFGLEKKKIYKRTKKMLNL